MYYRTEKKSSIRTPSREPDHLSVVDGYRPTSDDLNNRPAQGSKIFPNEPRVIELLLDTKGFRSSNSILIGCKREKATKKEFSLSDHQLHKKSYRLGKVLWNLLGKRHSNS